MSLVDRKLSLRADLHQFPPNAFGSVDSLLHPDLTREFDTLMVTCSELGTAPDNVSFQTPNRCVTLQHLAASVPSRNESKRIKGLAFDSVEALFGKYRFRHIVVCGHLHCGVIRNWLGTPLADLSDIGSFRSRFQTGTRELVDQNYETGNFDQRVTLMVREHVLCQIDNLLSHEFIAKRVRTNETSVHGWVVDDETARVFGYSHVDSAFVVI
jgi:carbonic anhydrase